MWAASSWHWQRCVLGRTSSSLLRTVQNICSVSFSKEQRCYFCCIRKLGCGRHEMNGGLLVSCITSRDKTSFSRTDSGQQPARSNWCVCVLESIGLMCRGLINNKDRSGVKWLSSLRPKQPMTKIGVAIASNYYLAANHIRLFIKPPSGAIRPQLNKSNKSGGNIIVSKVFISITSVLTVQPSLPCQRAYWATVWRPVLTLECELHAP